MITKAIVQIIGFIVNIPCKYFLASAFSWSESDLQCVVTDGSKRRWKWGSFVMTFYFLFLLYGLGRHIYDFKSEGIFDTAYHTLYVIGYFCTMCDKANYLRCRHFYVPVLNGFIRYFLHFTEISTRNEKKSVGRQIVIMELCLKMLIGNIFTMPIFALVQYIRSTDSSVHLSSLFISRPKLFTILYRPIAFIQVLVMGSMISELTMNTITTVLPLVFYITTFSTFRVSRGTKANTTFLETNRNGQPNIISFIRTAQIVGKLYGNLLQGRILPLHFVLSYLAAISLFSLAQFRSTISWELVLILLSTGLSAAMGWLTILLFLGEYYRTGHVFLLSWKLTDWPRSSFERKFMKKFYRSCRPIEFISSPRIYRFRPVTMLKYLHFINWLLAKSLIAANR